MAKVNSSSSGCRAVVMAGQFWTRPPALRQQRRLASVNQRMRVSSAAGHGGKNSAWSQKELPNYAWSNRTLIYRDVKTFLNEIGGDPREARYWLTHFQRAGSFPAFAVLEVDTSVFDSREMVQSLAFGLSFLQRMDMKLVVVMGLPPEMEEEDSAKTKTKSSLARTTMWSLSCGGLGSSAMDSGLQSDSSGLSGGPRCSWPLFCAQSNPGHSSHLAVTAASESHIPEQLRGHPQSKPQDDASTNTNQRMASKDREMRFTPAQNRH